MTCSSSHFPRNMAIQQNTGASNAFAPPHVTGWKSTEDALSPPAASSPKSLSFPLPFPLVQCTSVHVATAILSLGPAYEACASIVIDSGIDGRFINELLSSTDNAELNRFIAQDLGISSILLRTKLRTLFLDMSATADSSHLLSAISDHSHEKMLWMKACLVLEACTKGARPFVGLVFKRLHDRVIKDVQTDVQRNFGSCELEDWDCSTCVDAADAKFTEDGPVTFEICAMDINGVAKCSDYHHLKPHVYVPCYLNIYNIPASYFPDNDAMPLSLPLLICPNPADLEKSKSGNSEKSSAKSHCPSVIIFRKLNLDSTTQHLTPFRVTRCEPSEPAIEFFAVVCFSRPGHTAKLVEAFLKQESLSEPQENLGFSFAFWALVRCGTDSFKQQKLSLIGLKQGHILRFDGDNIPTGIISGCRYMITCTSNYSFDVNGPIVCPELPFAAEAFSSEGSSLKVIKRSPVGRVRDAARDYHLKEKTPDHHWSGIRAYRLSSHHGEFCKLFCSHTSRELDFFDEKGTRSGEQLLNMIDMCSAFSKDNVFCSLFDEVKSDNREVLKLALENLRKAAVGRPISNQPKENGVRDLRNMMFHDFLTLDTHNFEALVACTKQLLDAICVVVSIVGDGHRNDYVVEALAEIEGLAYRDLTVVKLSESERQEFELKNEQMLEELEKAQEEKNALKVKLGRKFDAFPVCLKTDIQNDLNQENQISSAGGHGTIHRVRYRGQTLAVKLFKDSNAEGAAKRRELNSLTLLTHTNIVRMFYTVYDTLEDRRLARAPLGYAMELMARSANDKFECTRHQLLCIFEQIASALTFAHERNVIHFDVKPENILLDESCAVAKLCDFGCARTLHTTASLTASVSGVGGKIRGTLLYMAPELFDAIVEDPEQSKLCDIYSFGKTMWKLLHPQGKLYPQSEDEVTADVPSELKTLVERCTRRNPNTRPQSMSDVLEQLRNIKHALDLRRNADHLSTEELEAQVSSADNGGFSSTNLGFYPNQPPPCHLPPPSHGPPPSGQTPYGPPPPGQYSSHSLPPPGVTGQQLPPGWRVEVRDDRPLYINDAKDQHQWEMPGQPPAGNAPYEPSPPGQYSFHGLPPPGGAGQTQPSHLPPPPGQLLPSWGSGTALDDQFDLESECFTGSFESLDALGGMLDDIEIVSLEVALLGDGDSTKCLFRINPSDVGHKRVILPTDLAMMIQCARECVQCSDAARILPSNMHGVPTIDLLAAVCLFTMERTIPIYRYITVPFNGGAACTPESLKDQLPFMKLLYLGLRCLPKDSPYSIFRGTLFCDVCNLRQHRLGKAADTYKVGSTVIFPAPCFCWASDSGDRSVITFIMPDSTGIRLPDVTSFLIPDVFVIDGPSFWEVISAHETRTKSLVVVLKRAPAVLQYLSEDFHIRAEREHCVIESRATTATASLQPQVGVEDPIQPPVSAAAADAQIANTTIDSSAFDTFRRVYDSSETPEHVFQLMTNVYNFIIAVCCKYGASDEAARAFFEKLHDEVFQPNDITLKKLAIRLWDSCALLQLAPGTTIEFSSLVNRMLRECDPELLPCGCSVVRGINMLFKSDEPNVQLPGSTLHRGGTLPLRHLPFFIPGKKFRAPIYLSTAFKETTAISFWFACSRETGEPPVHWIIEIDPRGVDDTRYRLKNASMYQGKVYTEDSEYLFEPYSAFTVASVTLPAGNELTGYNPIVIVLIASLDGIALPDDLPVSPWN